MCHLSSIKRLVNNLHSSNMPSREATHAGSWYSDRPATLARQLDQWLAQVPDEVPGLGTLPIPGARIIIAPYVKRANTVGSRWESNCAIIVMPAMRIRDRVRPMPTRRWICPKRECGTKPLS